MNRHYYISDNLDDLETVKQELQEAGLDMAQIHVYSHRDSVIDVEARQLHGISDFTKRDVVRSGLIGFVIGGVAALAVLLVSHTLGWTGTAAGWIPFIFLAIVVFGFSAWEGGLRGIQEPNQALVKYHDAIKQGKHVFFVDVYPNQEEAVASIVDRHPQLQFAGDGTAAPGWLLQSQTTLQRFIKAMP